MPFADIREGSSNILLWPPLFVGNSGRVIAFWLPHLTSGNIINERTPDFFFLPPRTIAATTAAMPTTLRRLFPPPPLFFWKPLSIRSSRFLSDVAWEGSQGLKVRAVQGEVICTGKSSCATLTQFMYRSTLLWSCIYTKIDERFLSRIGTLAELHYSCHMMSSSLLDYSMGNSWDAHGITHSRSFLSESQLACLVVWQLGQNLCIADTVCHAKVCNYNVL